MATYKIIRFYQDEPSDVVYQGLSHAEAIAHCNNPATRGGRVEDGTAWFDGFEEDRAPENDHQNCAYCASGEAYEHNPEILDPEEWVCPHYRRKDFADEQAEIEHLGHCYVGYPGADDY